MRMAICCTILMPVCRACQDFLLLHTALRKGSSEGMPRADATTAKALAVVFLTYSSMLSMSGRMVEIMVARPAACTQNGSEKKGFHLGVVEIILMVNTDARIEYHMQGWL